VLARVKSCALIGLDAIPIEVEVDVARGTSSITIVGLPDAAVKEARERVWAAIRNSGLSFPYSKRLTINLAPADLRKEGPSYDLPIALGLLAASGQIEPAMLEGVLALGELSLDGAVRHVRGVLSAAHLARSQKLERVFVPAVNAAEAALIPDIEIIPVEHLIALIEHLLGVEPIPPYDRDSAPLPDVTPPDFIDFADIRGQEHIKRALEIAAAGGHNVSMVGAPGAGKTLLARAMVGVLPSMTLDESLEVTRIYSVADMLADHTPLVQYRPFRAPHYTISHAGLVGGGSVPRPGEISMAHRGVLFLDELPEFGNKLEALRQPLEDRTVTVSRAAGAMTFPANFMLIAAANPCPCGYYGDPAKACVCSSSAITRYRQRVSGPVLDRFDIHLEVPRVDFEKMTSTQQAEPSAAIRARVQAARDRQIARFAGTRMLCNADMTAGEINHFITLDAEGQSLMRAAMQHHQLSARGYHRVLKLSRTIADLEGSQGIKQTHLAEALQYRMPQGSGS
jgi:magnesium chelatase family protein